MTCPTCGAELAAAASGCPQCATVALDAGVTLGEAGISGRDSQLGTPVEPSARAADTATGVPGSPPNGLQDVSPARFPPGAELSGRYLIAGLLGKGGMGEVYRARDTRLGGEIALKLLPAGASDAGRLHRLLGEVRIARQITHPNVCRVHDVGEVDGVHFMTMELIEGEDLADLLARSGTLPIERAAEIGGQICDGLAAVHEKGILHRDLKPANLIIDSTGRVRLADFGLACLVGDATAGGTPAYMAPELFDQRDATVQSELYAVGLILYELFTGRRTFRDKTLAEMAQDHRERPPTTPAELCHAVPPAIDETIRRCLEKEPRSRPLSAAAVAAALRGGDAPEQADTEIRLRDWTPPELPEQPYPVLLPYRHPDLLAGRNNEIDALSGLLELPSPVVGLPAPSGTGKSSLLAGGLYPALRSAGRPAVLERHPAEPGVAGRLIDGLLQAVGGIAVADGDFAGFIDKLVEAEALAGGVPPVLILDQFEHLFRLAEGRRSRAVLGTLLAATCRRWPGRSSAPCRWLLAYRAEYHGQVRTWLTDVIADAEREGLGGDLESLPRDLTGPDRFQALPLAPLASPIGASADPVGDAAEVFQRAIEAPLALERDDGRRRYSWRFADGAAARLARALAEARVAQPSAPLAPELQVVLAHLLERAAPADRDGVRRVDVPDDVGVLIDRALEDHLRRALESAFPAARGAAQGRSRALLVLRELAGASAASGARKGGLPAAQLEQAIGAEGRAVLETLAGPATRLVVPSVGVQGRCYELSHDRLAEAVARLVDEEGRSGGLVIDSELLALRRLIGLQCALHRSGEPTATVLSGQRFRRIARDADALLWDADRRTWWAACQRQRRAALLRRAAVGLVAIVVAGLAGFVIRGAVERRAARAAILEQVAEGTPEAAAGALTDALAELEPAELLTALRARAKPLDLLDKGLGGIAVERRGEAVLRVAELALPLALEDTEDRYVRLASLLWALDYAPMRDPALADRARAIHERALAPLRAAHPPPDPEAVDWVDIPAGTFWMGAGPDEGRVEEEQFDEFPRHEVTISAFRMLAHEVTNAEYRRLFPDHPGDDDLPATSLSWYDATVYAAWLAGPGSDGRLPTEAEWEYAARSGCDHTYCTAGGTPAELDRVAWVLPPELELLGLERRGVAREAGENRPHPVALLQPNQHGLYDIYGNVGEWVSGWWGPYPETAQVDPVGPTSGGGRLLRGGSVFHAARFAHPSARGADSPDSEGPAAGLRPIRTDLD